MVLSEKHSKGGLGALVIVALLVVLVIVSATGCGSDTQSAAGTSTTVAAGSTGPNQGSTPGQGAPSGMPNGTPPAGGPGQNTSSTDSASSDSTTTTAVAAESTTTTEAATTTTTLDDDQYGDGIYKVGTDISSGLYKGATVAGTGHWEISSDANGAKYVASGDPTSQFYVKVRSGQYLKLTGVVIEKASSSADDDLASKDLSDGTYRAGYDIEVGWYTGTVTGDTTMGYWQISSDANGQTLVANEYPLNSFTFKVKSGQYVTLRGVTVSLRED